MVLKNLKTLSTEFFKIRKNLEDLYDFKVYLFLLTIYIYSKRYLIQENNLLFFKLKFFKNAVRFSDFFFDLRYFSFITQISFK